jgi:hypothetical protein
MVAAAHARNDLAQGAVVHVQHAPPGDRPWVDAGARWHRCLKMHRIVDHRGEQVVGRGDGVEIAGEMQVDLLHRQHLRLTAASGAALAAEHRAQARLAQRDHRAAANGVERIGQANCCGGLALARRGWIDGGHQNQLAASRRLTAASRRLTAASRRLTAASRRLTDGYRLAQIGSDLGDMMPVRLDVGFSEAQLGCDLPDGAQCRCARDFNVRRHDSPS